MERLQFARIKQNYNRVPQGANSPFYAEVQVEGKSANNKSEFAVCKFPTIVPNKPSESGISEYLATIFSVQFNLRSPGCVLLRSDHQTVASIEKNLNIHIKNTFGFASFLINNMITYSPFFLPLVDLLEINQLMFFDVLFLNSDRTVDNPNCGYNPLRNEIIPFDFGASLIPLGTSLRDIEVLFSSSNCVDRLANHLGYACFEPKIFEYLDTKIEATLKMALDVTRRLNEVMLNENEELGVKYTEQTETFLKFLYEHHSEIVLQLSESQ